MSYQIQLYNFTNPIPTYNGYPLATGGGAGFATATHETMYFDDPNSRFVDYRSGPDTDQALLIDTQFGDTLVPAGTRISFGLSTVVAQGGKQYVFMTTYSSTTNYPTEVGDGKSLMVVPRSPSTSSQFDPTQPYTVASAYSTGDIHLASTPIPPSYLGATCFAAGTLIDTANGPRAIETLTIGDLVLTRDHGLRPICWTGGRQLSEAALRLSPNLAPIQIRAGVLGPDQDQDLVVSPQHRLLVRSRIAERMAGAPEVLVAAKHLVNLSGIDTLPPAGGVTYYHMLFDRHEIVRSNGAWTESMYTGKQALLSVGSAASKEILTLFPELGAENTTPWEGARTLFTGREGRELARRHLKNDKRLMAA